MVSDRHNRVFLQIERGLPEGDKPVARELYEICVQIETTCWFIIYLCLFFSLIAGFSSGLWIESAFPWETRIPSTIGFLVVTLVSQVILVLLVDLIWLRSRIFPIFDYITQLTDSHPHVVEWLITQDRMVRAFHPQNTVPMKWRAWQISL